MLSLLSALAAASPPLHTPAAPPAALTVTYQTTFDLGGAADQLCGLTGLCDCTVTYEGTGRFVRSSGDRHTYRGTYRRTGGSCHEILTLWTPTSAEAHHTVRLNGDILTEWIAHASEGDIEPLRSGAKARGQVWLADFTAVIDPVSHTARHTESETGNAANIPIHSTHTLTVVFEP